MDQRLVRSNLPTIVLGTLARHNMHGYALIADIRRRFRYLCGPSTMYPLLDKMHKDGLVTSSWEVTADRPRKIYAITSKGEAALRVAVSETAAIMADLRELENGRVQKA